MNNEFDITKVRFGNYLQGLNEGSQGYLSNNMCDLKDVVESDYRFKFGKIKIIENSEYPFVNEDGVEFKYFYLVSEPEEKKYRPYTWEEREQLRGKWFKRSDGKADEELINGFYILNDGLFVINDKTAEHLLNYYVWLDGSPCGVPVEYDEIV